MLVNNLRGKLILWSKKINTQLEHNNPPSIVNSTPLT